MIGTHRLGGDLEVHRLGFGAMRITGPGVWGPPSDPDVAVSVLKRAVELGVDFIDTADAYGPNVSEELIRTWIDYKRENEADVVRLRPHPAEFSLYYDC